MKGQTVFYKSNILIEDTATVAGPREGEGPLYKYFDKIIEDDALGQKSYEAAEIKLHECMLKYLLNKTKRKESEVDICIAGDLLDELVGCSFALRELDICFMGVYNACATFAESLIVGAAMLESGAADRVICSTTSHFSSAERQYRFPLELGNQRTPLAQWTTTGAGGTMLNKRFGKVRLDCATIGRVTDYGVSDVNDMGAAMAPAAKETLLAHFKDTGRTPDYYDIIVTGDLGDAGNRLLKKITADEGLMLGDNYTDGGVLIFNRAAQDVGQGGSGASCSNLVFNGYLYKKMLKGELNKVLLVPTGALLSKTSALQGETVPAIAHAVSFERIGG